MAAIEIFVEGFPFDSNKRRRRLRLEYSCDTLAKHAAVRDAFMAFHTHPAALAYTFPSPELVGVWASNLPDQIFGIIDSIFAEINKALLRVNTSPLSAMSYASPKNKTN